MGLGHGKNSTKTLGLESSLPLGPRGDRPGRDMADRTFSRLDSRASSCGMNQSRRMILENFVSFGGRARLTSLEEGSRDEAAFGEPTTSPKCEWLSG